MQGFHLLGGIVGQKLFIFTLVCNFIFTSTLSHSAYANQGVCGVALVTKSDVPAHIEREKPAVAAINVEQKIGIEHDYLLESANAGSKDREALHQLFRMSGHIANFTQLIRDADKKGELKFGIQVSKNRWVELEYSEQSKVVPQKFILSKIEIVYSNGERAVLSEAPLKKDLSDFSKDVLTWLEAGDLNEDTLETVRVPMYLHGKLLQDYLKWPKRFEASSAEELRNVNSDRDRRALSLKYAGLYVKELFTKRSEKEVVRFVFTIGLSALVGYLMGIDINIFGRSKSKKAEAIDWNSVEIHKERIKNFLGQVIPEWRGAAPNVAQLLDLFGEKNSLIGATDITVGYGNSQRMIAFYSQREGSLKDGGIKHFESPTSATVAYDQARSITEFSQSGVMILTDLLMGDESLKSSMSVVIRRDREPQLYGLIQAALNSELDKYTVQPLAKNER